MKDIRSSIAGLVISIILLGMFTAAVLKLPVNPSIKIIILTAMTGLYLMFQMIIESIARVCENLGPIQYFIRSISISAELLRLEPDSSVSARNLLEETLKAEHEKQGVHESLGRQFGTFGFLSYGVLFVTAIEIVGVILVSGMVFGVWDIVAKILP